MRASIIVDSIDKGWVCVEIDHRDFGTETFDLPRVAFPEDLKEGDKLFIETVERRIECPTCYGTKIDNMQDTCKTCNGSGKV